MAHGAPDHTRLSDDAFSHYTVRHFTDTTITIPSGIATELFNQDFIGVFGYVIVDVDYSSLSILVYVDGTNVYYINAATLFDTFNLGSKAGAGGWGVSKFDDINNRYVLWLDADYHVYVKSNLTIMGLQGSGVDKNVLRVKAYYKMLI